MLAHSAMTGASSAIPLVICLVPPNMVSPVACMGFSSRASALGCFSGLGALPAAPTLLPCLLGGAPGLGPALGPTPAPPEDPVGEVAAPPRPSSDMSDPDARRPVLLALPSCCCCCEPVELPWLPCTDPPGPAPPSLPSPPSAAGLLVPAGLLATEPLDAPAAAPVPAAGAGASGNAAYTCAASSRKACCTAARSPSRKRALTSTPRSSLCSSCSIALVASECASVSRPLPGGVVCTTASLPTSTSGQGTSAPSRSSTATSMAPSACTTS
mmetsp:Transcript_28736/g.73112  ORF Transcript_28736/g.73112 Transcript_28736/m.73112 type:complete len:270 (+) Transcript_28736:418-1227(+)